MGRPSVLVIDNQDSFTFMLVDHLRCIGAEVRVERSDELGIEEALQIASDAILISPGPGTAEESGICVPLARSCVERGKPLLGVCLGHQAIAIACGSRVERVAPVHGKVATVRHDGTGIFSGLPSPLPMTRYHSLGIRELRSPLIANAWSEDGVAMAFRHETAAVHGVQFHPESVASAQGHALLEKFIRIATQSAES